MVAPVPRIAAAIKAIKKDTTEAISSGYAVQRYAAGGQAIADAITTECDILQLTREFNEFMLLLSQLTQNLINASAGSQRDAELIDLLEYIKTLNSIISSANQQDNYSQGAVELALHNALQRFVIVMQTSQAMQQPTGAQAVSTNDDNSGAQQLTGENTAEISERLAANHLAGSVSRDLLRTVKYAAHGTEQDSSLTIDAAVWHVFMQQLCASTSFFLSWFDSKNTRLKAINRLIKSRYPQPSRIPVSYLNMQMQQIIAICSVRRHDKSATTKSLTCLKKAVSESSELQKVLPAFSNQALANNLQPSAKLPPHIGSSTKMVIRCPLNTSFLEDDESSERLADENISRQQTTAFEHKGIITQITMPHLISEAALNNPIKIKRHMCGVQSWSWHPELAALLSNSDNLWLKQIVDGALDSMSNQAAMHRISQVLQQTTISRYAGESVSNIGSICSTEDKLTILCDLASTLHDLEGLGLYYYDLSSANLLWDGEAARLCDIDSIISPLAATADKQPSHFYPHSIIPYGVSYAHKIGLVALLYYMLDKDGSKELSQQHHNKIYAQQTSNHARPDDINVTASDQQEYQRDLTLRLTKLTTSSNQETKHLAQLALKLLRTQHSEDLKSTLGRARAEYLDSNDITDLRDADNVIAMALQDTASNLDDIDHASLKQYWGRLSPSLHFNERYSKLVARILRQQVPPPRPSFNCWRNRQPLVADRSESESEIFARGNRRQSSIFQSMLDNDMPGLQAINLDTSSESGSEPASSRSGSQNLSMQLEPDRRSDSATIAEDGINPCAAHARYHSWSPGLGTGAN